MQIRPLSHIRVLDFGQYLAGPLVGMMLADLGAEVIRINPPGGPRFKSPAFAGTSSAVVRLGSLHAIRIAALQVESSAEIDLTRATFRLIRHDRHPMGRWCDLVAPNAVRPERGRITIPEPMSKYGAHTRDVLGRLGYAPDAIETMIASGAAGESWSKKYLPE